MKLESLGPEVALEWAEQAIPSLTELIRIPAVSPAYGPAWHDGGHLRRAAEHGKDWGRGRALPGGRCEIVDLAGRPPVLVIEVEPHVGYEGSDTVLLYGH